MLYVTYSARDQFMACVTEAGRLCSHSGSSLLRNMAWVLAKDVAACEQTRPYCAAPAAIAAPLLTIVSALLAHQPELL